MSAQVWLAIVGGVLSLITAGFLALLNAWISTRAGVDEVLRSQRLELYPKLWSATAAVSRWPRVQVTRGSLEDLHAALRSWYYAMGGLFLSGSARARYGDVQKLIETLLEHKGNYPSRNWKELTLLPPIGCRVLAVIGLAPVQFCERCRGVITNGRGAGAGSRGSPSAGRTASRSGRAAARAPEAGGVSPLSPGTALD